jgi:hypothetical protein
MSRGERLVVSGNLSMSMRKNYGENGVSEVCFYFTGNYIISIRHFSITLKWDLHIAIPTTQAFDFASSPG